MIKTVPHGWASTAFGEVVQRIEGGGTPSRTVEDYWNGEIPWATVKDLIDTKLHSTQETITELGLRESSSRLIPKNTVILATRMAVGKAVVFDTDVAINQDLKAVFPTKSVDWKFLLQWYLSKSTLIEAMGTGSTVKGIRLEELKSLPLDLPPLPEQQKIAAILTSVDDVIEGIAVQISKLKDLKKGMMQELLTNGIGHTEFKESPLGRIPKGWEIKELDEVCSAVGVGIASSTTHAYAKEGVPILRNQNIREGEIDNSDLLFITERFAAENKSKAIKTGDVITIRTGYPGVSAVVPERFHDCHTFTTLISRPNSQVIDANFLATWINSDYGKTFVLGGQAGGAQQNLNVSIFKRLPVVLPPLEEQQAIHRAISSTYRLISDVQEKLSTSRNLKKALMQELLTGKVRVKVS